MKQFFLTLIIGIAVGLGIYFTLLFTIEQHQMKEADEQGQLTRTLKATQNTADMAHKKLDEIDQAYEKLHGSYQELVGRSQAMLEQLDFESTKAKFEAERQQLSELAGQINTELNTTQEKIQAKLHTQRDQITGQWREQLAEKDAALAQAQTNFENLKNQLSAGHAKIDAATIKIAQAKQTLQQQLSNDQASMSTALQQQAQQLAAQSEAIKHLQSSKELLQTQLNQQNQQIASLKKTLVDTQASLKALSAQPAHSLLDGILQPKADQGADKSN